MASSGRYLWILFMPALALGSIGCSGGDRPELGRVQGTVTLDGKPLSGAVVMFLPESGRPAVANTDSAGKYDLIYTHGVNGAKVGPNTVRVVWPDDGPAPVPIPAKYNDESQLKKDVKAGSNTFDLKLDSK